MWSCVKLYMEQVTGGRFFIHEHPHEAKPWHLQCVTQLLSMESVDIVLVDMCSYGLTSIADGVEGPARKRTNIMSNSIEVLRKVERSCPNTLSDKSAHHRHIPLDQGRAKAAQVYPRAFCRQVCEAILAEKRNRAIGVTPIDVMNLEELKKVATKSGQEECEDPSGALHEPEGAQAYDDVSG